MITTAFYCDMKEKDGLRTRTKIIYPKLQDMRQLVVDIHAEQLYMAWRNRTMLFLIPLCSLKTTHTWDTPIKRIIQNMGVCYTALQDYYKYHFQEEERQNKQNRISWQQNIRIYKRVKLKLHVAMDTIFSRLTFYFDITFQLLYFL